MLSSIVASFLSGVEQSLPELLDSPSQEKWLKFYFDLEWTRFIVPVDDLDMKPFLVNAQNTSGAYIPVFTCEGEYKHGSFEEATPAVMSFNELKQLMDGNFDIGGIVINLFGRQAALSRVQLKLIEIYTASAQMEATQSRCGNYRQ